MSRCFACVLSVRKTRKEGITKLERGGPRARPRYPGVEGGGGGGGGGGGETRRRCRNLGEGRTERPDGRVLRSAAPLARLRGGGRDDTGPPGGPAGGLSLVWSHMHTHILLQFRTLAWLASRVKCTSLVGDAATASGLYALGKFTSSFINGQAQDVRWLINWAAIGTAASCPLLPHPSRSRLVRGAPAEPAVGSWPPSPRSTRACPRRGH